MILFNPHCIRNKPDDDDFHKAEIPGFCPLRMAAADYYLDLLCGNSSPGIPILLKKEMFDDETGA